MKKNKETCTKWNEGCTKPLKGGGVTLENRKII